MCLVSTLDQHSAETYLRLDIALILQRQVVLPHTLTRGRTYQQAVVTRLRLVAPRRKIHTGLSRLKTVFPAKVFGALPLLTALPLRGRTKLMFH